VKSLCRIQYFREPEGDYLAIFLHLKCTDRRGVTYDGRATAIRGLPSSVCTVGISKTFLKRCRRVERREVPLAWLQALGV
jgi:hypothetical protein